MAMPKGAFTQTEEAKALISEAAKKQWADPKVRARRSERMREGWKRRREELGICSTCGQPLPEESGRD